MINVDIEKAEFNKIIKQIEPRRLEATMVVLVERMSVRAKILTRKYLEPTNKNRGTDFAQRSIQLNAKPLHAAVYTTMPQGRALSIEHGRMPGEKLPLKPIARWYHGSLYVRSTTINNYTDDQLKPLRGIQKNIEEKGAKGKHMFEKARARVSKDIQYEIKKAAEDVEKRWGN